MKRCRVPVHAIEKGIVGSVEIAALRADNDRSNKYNQTFGANAMFHFENKAYDSDTFSPTRSGLISSGNDNAEKNLDIMNRIGAL